LIDQPDPEVWEKRPKPRLKPVWIFRHLWTGERLEEPVLGWACEGWVHTSAHSAFICWWYDGSNGK
jgi:hypothetical protein